MSKKYRKRHGKTDLSLETSCRCLSQESWAADDRAGEVAFPKLFGSQKIRSEFLMPNIEFYIWLDLGFALL